MSNDITVRMASMKAAALKAKSEANEWGYDTDAFHDEATPDAVIELVEALENAQTERDEFRNRLKLERGILADADKRIAELEKAASEPVAWTDEAELRDVEKDGCGYLFTVNPITPNADPRRVIKLYTVSPAQESRTVTAAASDVLAERQRQISAEGWSPEHDDEHVEGQIADAAACYALFATDQRQPVPAYWPWSDNWWKQRGQRRDLVRAGALIIAEIERIDRAAGIQVIEGEG